MTTEHKPHSEPALEQLLAEGKVSGALILKGKWSAEDAALVQQAYAHGVAHGRKGLEEQLEALVEAARLLENAPMPEVGKPGFAARQRLSRAVALYDSNPASDPRDHTVISPARYEVQTDTSNQDSEPKLEELA